MDLICTGCGRRPSEIGEYIAAVADEATFGVGMTPEEYVWEEEGTLNTRNGHFLCTACYIRAGLPTAPSGWVAP